MRGFFNCGTSLRLSSPNQVSFGGYNGSSHKWQGVDSDSMERFNFHAIQIKTKSLVVAN